jgi:uncharacterized membrane protein
VKKNIKKMQNNLSPQRLNFIDALRGLAVLLMMEQHLGIWFWDGKIRNLNNFVYQLLFGFNALGGFAAPVFIVLAGVGSSFFIQRHSDSNTGRILFLRGCVIMLYGYMLNILTPGWFSIGSWYVLHLIGFAILLSPFIGRLSDRTILIIFALLLVSTAVIQNLLNTPFFLSNERMRNLDLEGGAFRLAFAEGQFPIFPWLCFFLSGLITGRWLIDKKISHITRLASVFFATAALFSVLFLLGFNFAIYAPLVRVFRLNPGFYPISTNLALILISLVLFSILIFRLIGLHRNISNSNPLVCLGRSSLTLLIVHVVIFREVLYRLDLQRKLPAGAALVSLFMVLTIFTLLTSYWRKYNYRYGAEWLLRKIAG